MKKFLLYAIYVGICLSSCVASASGFDTEKMLKMIPVAGDVSENSTGTKTQSNGSQTEELSSPLGNILTGSVKIDSNIELPNKKECKKIIKKAGYKFNNEDFLNVVKASDANFVKLYLKAGMNPDASDKAQNSALIWASFKGDTEVIKTLIQNGADVTKSNTDGFSVLHAAVENGNIENIEYLVSKGANINAKTFDSKTSPLHTASFKGDTENVKYLVENGADFNAYNAYGASPLTVACFYGKKDVIQTLIKAGADVNTTTDKTPLKAALESGNTEIFEILINNGADIDTVDDTGITLLEAAAAKNDVKTVQFLLEKGAKATNEGTREGALYKAILNENPEMVKLLVKNGADVNEKEPQNSFTVLQTAILKNNDEITDFFIKENADLNQLNNFGFSAADIALASGSDKLDKLCKKGGLFSKAAGEILVKYGCSVKFDEEKNMFSIAPQDARRALAKLETDEKVKKEYDDYMKKTRNYREQRNFTPDKHAFKIYPLFFEILK